MIRTTLIASLFTALLFTSNAVQAADSAAAAPAPAAPPTLIDLSGYWTGTWQSTNSRHHGPLKANFCKIDDMTYEVHFRGRFFRILPFRYTVTLNVVEVQDGQVVLAGTSYLGRMFGTFKYTATATNTRFVADYSSCKYLGQFCLERCCQ